MMHIKNYAGIENSHISYYHDGYDLDEYDEDNEDANSYSSTKDEAIVFFKDLNNAIYEAPRPQRSFWVFRGIHGQKYRPGDFVNFLTSKSGTFNINVPAGYVGDKTDPECCYMRIFIPKNSILGYHPSEDQVIFPSGTKLYITKGPVLEEGKKFYTAIYTDVPSNPVGDCLDKNLYKPEWKEILEEKMVNDDSFPYVA